MQAEGSAVGGSAGGGVLGDGGATKTTKKTKKTKKLTTTHYTDSPFRLSLGKPLGNRCGTVPVKHGEDNSHGASKVGTGEGRLPVIVVVGTSLGEELFAILKVVLGRG